MKGTSYIPRSTTPAWNCDDHACRICTAPERDDMTLMRCAILTLLEHGRWMASDDIPLRDILSAGGKYLTASAAVASQRPPPSSGPGWRPSCD